MAYDSISDFTSPEPFDGWWFYAAGNAQICASAGALVVADIRGALNLPRSNVWDISVQTALIQRVQSMVADDPVWSSVQSALAVDNGQVSNLAMTVGLYLAYYRPAGRQFNAISIPADARMPTWGSTIPSPNTPDAVGIVCWPMGSPAAQTEASNRLAALHTASTTGIRMAPGEHAPIEALNVSSGIAGVPWWTIGLFAVVVVGGVTIFALRDKS